MSLTTETDAFKVTAPLHGFKENDLECKFEYQGDTFKIIGWLRNAHKYPVFCEREDGKQIIVSLDLARKGLDND